MAVRTAPGLDVCLWKGEEIYRVITADKTGKASFEVDLKTPGALLITVTGPAANTTTRDVPVG